MTNKSYHRGFSLVGVLIAILAVVLLAGSGWYIWQKNKSDNKQANNSSSQSGDSNKDNQNNTKDPSDPSEGGKYLVISEWGVKIPLSDSIKRAYYTFQREGIADYVALYDAAFDDEENANGVSCGGQHKYQFYSISRVRPENVAAASEFAAPEYKEFSFTDEYLFGGLGQHQAAPYCSSLNPNGTYQEDQAILEIADAKERAFDKAFSGMRPIN